MIHEEFSDNHRHSNSGIRILKDYKTIFGLKYDGWNLFYIHYDMDYDCVQMKCVCKTNYCPICGKELT